MYGIYALLATVTVRIRNNTGLATVPRVHGSKIRIDDTIRILYRKAKCIESVVCSVTGYYVLIVSVTSIYFV